MAASSTSTAPASRYEITSFASQNERHRATDGAPNVRAISVSRTPASKWDAAPLFKPRHVRRDRSRRSASRRRSRSSHGFVSDATDDECVFFTAAADDPAAMTSSTSSSPATASANAGSGHASARYTSRSVARPLCFLEKNGRLRLFFSEDAADDDDDTEDDALLVGAGAVAMASARARPACSRDAASSLRRFSSTTTAAAFVGDSATTFGTTLCFRYAEGALL
mmetsp:Transcript_38717/g.124121  ORF Transcript_38717/g.124121 Transcript_38717/m.124121 type:complete len:224 (-) Transcript_38717:507-1178(-)